MEVGVV